MPPCRVRFTGEVGLSAPSAAAPLRVCPHQHAPASERLEGHKFTVRIHRFLNAAGDSDPPLVAKDDQLFSRPLDRHRRKLSLLQKLVQLGARPLRPLISKLPNRHTTSERWSPPTRPNTARVPPGYQASWQSVPTIDHRRHRVRPTTPIVVAKIAIRQSPSRVFHR